ncbi:unnamed protein product [Leuciscus chuanchicus]
MAELARLLIMSVPVDQKTEVESEEVETKVEPEEWRITATLQAHRTKEELEVLREEKEPVGVRTKRAEVERSDVSGRSHKFKDHDGVGWPGVMPVEHKDEEKTKSLPPMPVKTLVESNFSLVEKEEPGPWTGPVEEEPCTTGDHMMKQAWLVFHLLGFKVAPPPISPASAPSSLASLELLSTALSLHPEDSSSILI